MKLPISVCETLRLQTAIEYLATYGWAILIMALMLAVLFSTGVFSPNSYIVQECVVSSGFGCQSFSLTPDGNLLINLVQSTSDPINVTALGCTRNGTVSGGAKPPYPAPPSNQVYLPVGSNYTFIVGCYGANAISVGGVFSGSLVVNYTDQVTKVPLLAYGKVVVKVT
ncbi:Uncharacterised protein [uncultured archaeon]|nr:Uncharacterised protein [uncultured archaeon]